MARQNGAVAQSAYYSKVGRTSGISFLFGAMLQQSIVGIAVRFHGDNDESVTIYKATKEKLHDHSIGSLEIGVLRHRRCTPGGGGGTAIYGLYRYVPL